MSGKVFHCKITVIVYSFIQVFVRGSLYTVVPTVKWTTLIVNPFTFLCLVIDVLFIVPDAH